MMLFVLIPEVYYNIFSHRKSLNFSAFYRVVYAVTFVSLPDMSFVWMLLLLI